MFKMSKEKRERQLDGMYTLEAAVLVPLIFLVVIVLVYLGLFYLERAYVISRVDVITECAAHSFSKGGEIQTGKWEERSGGAIGVGSDTDVSSKEAKEMVEKSIHTMFDHRLLIFSNVKVETDISMGTIRTKVSLEKITSILSEWGMDTDAYCYEKKAGISNGAEWIRRWQAFEK